MTLGTRSVAAYDPDAVIWRYMPGGPYASAADLHAQTRADFIELAEIRRERIAQRSEARIAMAEDRRFASDQDPSRAS